MPADSLTDYELLALLKTGDRAAFSEIYDRHWLSLYNIAYKRLKDRETSQDLVHDVFADLWDKRLTYNIKEMLPYLHTAVRNAIYSLLSKGHASAFFVEPFENMAISTLTADSFFDEKQLRKLMLLWMETLPSKRREIFRLRFLEGLSTREISEQLKVSQKTVQNQLLLAVNDLRLNLNKILSVAFVFYFSKK